MKFQTLKIGITGGISSGKSTVLEYLKTKKYATICADEVYHKLLKTNKRLVNLIISEFECRSETGNLIDRKKLGQLVFNDKIKLDKLNSITHPYILKEITKIVKFFKKEKYIFIDIPLLFETNLTNTVDKIITVYCPKYMQIERMISRNNINRTEAIKRINSQLPIKYKMERSDFVIYNKKKINDVYKQIDNIIKKIYYETK
ncbi:dephospho-CoA kinase [Candidatus Dependentiae bacterium]|nr:dephospho-CoA kinase [Candidatus Dependentiae bacterium]